MWRIASKELADRDWSLLDELERADPARVRELLRRAVDRIQLSFAARQQGEKKEIPRYGGQGGIP